MWLQKLQIMSVDRSMGVSVPGWRQDQCENSIWILAQLMEYGKDKGSSFSAARLSNADTVSSSNSSWNYAHLHVLVCVCCWVLLRQLAADGNARWRMIVDLTWTGVGCLIPRELHVFTRCADRFRSANEPGSPEGLGSPEGVATSCVDCARRSSGASSRRNLLFDEAFPCFSDFARFFLPENKRSSTLSASSAMSTEDSQ